MRAEVVNDNAHIVDDFSASSFGRLVALLIILLEQRVESVEGDS